jgi:hypothetical protein
VPPRWARRNRLSSERQRRPAHRVRGAQEPVEAEDRGHGRGTLVISDAIRRARAALEADPGNSELNAMVNATWQKKVELLEKAVRLSSEI